MSTTVCTSLIVIELSAMFVASTTFTLPSAALWNTMLCSCFGSAECSGTSQSLSLGCNFRWTAQISAQPGRKHNMEPLSFNLSSSSSRLSFMLTSLVTTAAIKSMTQLWLAFSPHQLIPTAFAAEPGTAGTPCATELSPSLSAAARPSVSANCTASLSGNCAKNSSSKKTSSTGNLGPDGTSTNATESKYSLNVSLSSVALMSTSRKSGRFGNTSRNSVNKKSVIKSRSCTSSTTITS
mmetsp:Transcript_3759/g.9586  ORF Transcript_3759/g.9586 Transcript_3759/m.9586 type:complete len:238 (+) Transcript_3759:647-1360(+)